MTTPKMAEEKKVSLRLLIDPKANKVLFAEAGKDFVDFLFNLLSLPVGTLVKLLADKGKVVSLKDVCNNIETLQNAKLGNRAFYRCFNSSCYCSRSYVTDRIGQICPGCETSLSSQMAYVVPKTPIDLTAIVGNGSTAIGGGRVAYIVMDDLEVKPMPSIISGITLVNDFNVKNVATLVEKQVQIGLIQGVELLKASLQTKEALTTVFL